MPFSRQPYIYLPMPRNSQLNSWGNFISDQNRFCAKWSSSLHSICQQKVLTFCMQNARMLTFGRVGERKLEGTGLPPALQATSCAGALSLGVTSHPTLLVQTRREERVTRNNESSSLHIICRQKPGVWEPGNTYRGTSLMRNSTP